MAFFSVVIPSYNDDAAMLAQLVRAVAAEAGPGVEIEILLVDDGSAPALDLAGIGPDLPKQARHVVLRHDGNRGLAAARNTGLAAAGGQYVVLLDSDDRLEPGSLAALRRHLEKQPADVTLTLTRVQRPNGRGEVPRGDRAIADACTETGRGGVTPHSVPELALIMSSWAQVYAREFLRRSGLSYDERLRRWEDRPFIIKSQIAAARIGFFNQVLHHYCLEGGSITRRRFDRNDMEMMKNHIDQVAAVLAAGGLADSAYANWHFWHSLTRLLSVMGTALVPRLMFDKTARDLCFETALRLYRTRPLEANGRLAAPHPALPAARMPGLLRKLVVAATGRAGRFSGRSVLMAVFGLLALLRARRVPAQ